MTARTENGRLPSRWQRDAAFAIVMTVSAALLLVLFSAGSAILQSKPRPVSDQTPSTSATSSLTNYSTVPARSRNVIFAGPTPGLMQPAVDAHGNVWFGEMGTNALGRLDPTINALSTWTPPNGKYNIMQVVPDAHGNIWFTEQAGNFIGMFNPATQRFTEYPLRTSNGFSSAPQDLQFDGHGDLWFTLITAGAIGRLDPRTGTTTYWNVPVPSAGGRVFPYSLAIGPHGTIWYGYLSGGAIGSLVPATGATRVFHLSHPDAQVFNGS